MADEGVRGSLYFEERLRFSWRLMLLIALPIIIILVIVFAIDMMGATPDDELPDWFYPVMILAFGILLPGMFASLSLRTEIRSDGIHVRFFPLKGWRRIPLEDVASWDVRTIHPIRDYCGYGYRIGRNGLGYIVSGDQALVIRLRAHSGILKTDRLAISTRDPEAMGRALNILLPDSRDRSPDSIAV